MARLEHIGIAAADIEQTAALYEALFGVRPYKTETVEREGVRTHFVSAESAKLELLEALSEESPVAKHIAKRGQGLHHLAFEVDDIRAAYGRLALAGFTLLHPEPKPGADGKEIFFIHPKQTEGVLIEFCASTPTPFVATAVETPAGAVAVYECGDYRNPTLMVVHDIGRDTLAETEPLVRMLEQHFHVIALDLPGHGQSATPDAPLQVMDYVVSLRTVLDFFSMRRVHMFGVAEGGSLAMMLALTYPAYVDRLAVYNPMSVVAGPDVSTGDGAALAQLTPEVLDQLEAPTLLATYDERSMDDLMVLHRHIPEASLAILPDAGPGLDDVDLEILERVLRRWYSR